MPKIQVGVVKELVAAKASIRITDINGNTPLQLYIRCVRVRTISILNNNYLLKLLQEDPGGRRVWEETA